MSIVRRRISERISLGSRKIGQSDLLTLGPMVLDVVAIVTRVKRVVDGVVKILMLER
jgi:hypothetical protein